MRNNQKPLLFVDIDGVLSLFGFQSDRRPQGIWLNVEGIVHLISASASEHLHRLAAPFDLVWCSGWEEKANDHLLGALVLPAALPFLTFSAQEAQPGTGSSPRSKATRGTGRWHGSTTPTTSRAGRGRPQRPAPTLLVTTDPAAGLTVAHVEALEHWAAGLTPAADHPGR